eukprot:8822842-Pyramimonas_sp.AAC.1
MCARPKQVRTSCFSDTVALAATVVVIEYEELPSEPGGSFQATLSTTLIGLQLVATKASDRPVVPLALAASVKMLRGHRTIPTQLPVGSFAYDTRPSEQVAGSSTSLTRCHSQCDRER